MLPVVAIVDHIIYVLASGTETEEKRAQPKELRPLIMDSTRFLLGQLMLVRAGFRVYRCTGSLDDVMHGGAPHMVEERFCRVS